MQAFIRKAEPFIKQFNADPSSLPATISMLHWLDGIIAGYLEAYDVDFTYYQWVEHAYPLERGYAEAMTRALSHPLETIDRLDKLGR